MQPTKKTARALLLVLDEAVTPYSAAKRAGINLTTMYKSRLYKMIRDGQGKEARRELDEIMARN